MNTNLSNIPLKEARRKMEQNPELYREHKKIERQFQVIIFPKMANLLKKPLSLQKDYEEYSLREIYDLYFEALKEKGYTEEEIKEEIKRKRH